MRPTHRQPLDPFRPGAYRPQRWDAVLDLLDDGYVQRLPPRERQYMARFLREAYGANATALRTGLHADVPRALAGPVRARRWWKGVERLWPTLNAEQRERAVRGAGAMRLRLKQDPTRRRSVYAEQNAATRDVYSLRRVVPVEDVAESLRKSNEENGGRHDEEAYSIISRVCSSLDGSPQALPAHGSTGAFNRFRRDRGVP